MKKQRFFLFYLLASLLLAQGILDCGCLYAAVNPAPKLAAMESGMPCHDSAHSQEAPGEKNCCGACYLAKYALFPRSVELQAGLNANPSFIFSGAAFSGLSGALPENAGLPQSTSAFAMRHTRGVSVSVPALLASVRLLI